MLFKICCENANYYYNNDNGIVYDENMIKIDFRSFPHLSPYFGRVVKKRGDMIWRSEIAQSQISKKDKHRIDTIKLMLGIKCNYSCKYCIQSSYKGNTFPTNFSKQKFIEMFRKAFNWDRIDMVEVWGGEPFVYWKLFKPVIEAIREDIGFRGKIITITNGSLFDEEKADFVLKHDINISFSHDGPAQTIYRHPTDYLDDPVVKKGIMKLIDHGYPMMFNIVPNPYTYDLPKTRQYIEDKLGTFVFATSEPIFRACKDTEFILDDYGDMNDVRDKFIQFILAKPDDPDYWLFHKFRIISKEVVTDIVNHRLMSSYTNGCPSQKPTTISVDVQGRNCMCHNAFYDGGVRMKGDLNDIDQFFVHGLHKTQSRSWCRKCPYIVVCNGCCPDLDDENHLIQCKSLQPYVQAHLAAAWYTIFNDKIVSITSCDESETSYY